MLFALACAPQAELTPPARLEPWATLVAEAALHLGFEDVAGDRTWDDSPNALEAIGDGDLTGRLVEGPRGNALTFNGSDEYLYLLDADALDPYGPFTVVVWMRADPRDGVRAYPLVDKYAYVDGAWTGFGAWLDGGQPYAGVYSGVETATECGGPSQGVFDDGAWHLYAAAWTGADVVVSVDAMEVRRCAWTEPPVANDDIFEVGTRGGSFLFLGALDDVTLVPRALDTAEIAALSD